MIISDHTDHTDFPVIPDLPLYSCDFPKKKKEKKTQVQFVLLIYSLKHSQISSGQPLKENWVFLHLNPQPRSSVVESYTLASLLQFLKVSFLVFCLDCYSGGERWGGERGCPWILNVLFLNWVCNNWNHPKSSFIPFYSQREHRSWTSWFLVTMWIHIKLFCFYEFVYFLPFLLLFIYSFNPWWSDTGH